MWRQVDERWAARAVWALLLLGICDRTFLLFTFGFRYIGIDDALIQQVALDYGNGLFREPFLYGQNYNPMLEALLAAPFMRLGGAPWVVLPIVTSILALLPFWSFAWWSMKRASFPAAMILAAMPLVLPTEWGMMTTMSRGFVHGIALTALVPWLQDLRRPLLKHISTALVLVTALFCNPNALPLVAGICIWLITQHFKSMGFWMMNTLATVAYLIIQDQAQGFFRDHPQDLIHPLAASDLIFKPELIGNGILHIGDHLLHQSPFSVATPILVPIVLLGSLILLWKHSMKQAALALLSAVVVMVLALGVVKVHEGCASVFFPLSRMFLTLPLLLSISIGLLLWRSVISRWVAITVPILLAMLVTGKIAGTERVIENELAQQSCAYVREEKLTAIHDRCALIKAAADRQHADLIVPIRWPGIRVDHRSHFMAHFSCYACEVLVKKFPRVHGLGYDRRSWTRPPNDQRGTVLFVGGDPTHWQAAMTNNTSISAIREAEIELHAITCSYGTMDSLILALGVDDDLHR